MAVSARLNLVVEAKLTEQVALPGIKNPSALLKQMRSKGKMGRPNASTNVSKAMRTLLRTRHSD